MRKPRLADKYGIPIRLTQAQKLMLQDCLLSETGCVWVVDVFPSREETGRARTIFALQDKGLLCNARRKAGFHSYPYKLTAQGRREAARLLNEEMERLRNERERTERVPKR